MNDLKKRMEEVCKRDVEDLLEEIQREGYIGPKLRKELDIKPLDEIEDEPPKNSTYSDRELLEEIHSIAQEEGRLTRIEDLKKYDDSPSGTT
ncbi:MAG: hypothetical protein ABEJ72_07605, partial [Candidatus Aenigmatarchaeota archaeon]